MNKETSSRDIKLLGFVLAIVIAAGAYFFGTKPLNEETNAIKAETQQIKARIDELAVFRPKREAYETDTQNYITERENIIHQYQEGKGGFSQADTIETFVDLEEKNEIFITSVEYANVDNSYEFLSMPGFRGLTADIQLEFEGEYDNTKVFLNDILTNVSDPTAIESLEMEYSLDTGVITSTLGLKYFALQSATAPNPAEPIEMECGVENIFSSEGGVASPKTMAENFQYIRSDYDLCAVVSPNGADLDAIIMGTSNNSKAKDSISVDENGETELTVTFMGKEGKYTVNYQLGDEKYPTKNFDKGATIKVGDTLDFLIQSTERSDKKDKVALTVNFVNETDMELNVLIADDDENSPRVSVGDRKGEVKIYR
ncbi:MAG: hypothetical protein K6C69_06190 [Lachnospiraceae bacterium]|nr:hypothetical protein [Lachnospiraceae bacterium]